MLCISTAVLHSPGHTSNGTFSRDRWGMSSCILTSLYLGIEFTLVFPWNIAQYTVHCAKIIITPVPLPFPCSPTRVILWRTWLFIAYLDERWLYYQFLLPHSYIFSFKCWENVPFELGSERVNVRSHEESEAKAVPFTLESDQFQISPAAKPELSHHAVWRTWLFIAYSDERWLYHQFLLPHSYIFSFKCWENVLFELGSERVRSGQHPHPMK